VTTAAALASERPLPRRRVQLPPATLSTAAGIVAVIGLWELVARTVFADKHIIAAPSGIVSATFDNLSLYERAVRFTVTEAAWGFLWGNVVAVALAGFVAVVPFSERVVLRVALVVFCLPLVAIGPTLRVVYGTGTGPQVTLAAMAVFYTTLVPLLVGLRAVPQTWAELVASYGRGRFTALRVVRLRAAVPYLVAGLQVAVPAAFLGALVGEFTGAERGVGVLTINAMRALRTDELWALATISALVSMAGYALAAALGTRLAAGRPAVLLAAPPAPSFRRGGTVRALRAFAELVVTLLIVLLLWEGSMRLFDLNRYFAKRPGDVWQWLVTSPDAAAHRDEILDALGKTAQIAIPGYLVGLAVGALVAAVFDVSASVRRTVTPFTIALRCVPIVAIAPLLVQALGRGLAGTIMTVAILTFFPTLVACSQGLRQTPGQVLDFYAIYDTGRLRTLLTAQAPAMLPAFFAAARIAVPATVLAATVAEWLATGTGMGNLMAVSAVNGRWGTMWASVTVLTLIAAVAYGVVSSLERLVLAQVAPEQLTW
jgi:ABC-type nitrate/sulfonate/bicarbonate transport system permease component